MAAGIDSGELGCYTLALTLAIPNSDTLTVVHSQRVAGIHLAAFALGLVEDMRLAVGVDWGMFRPSCQGRLESIVPPAGILGVGARHLVPGRH